MSHRVTVIPGDSTGPEILDGLLPLLHRTGVDLTFDELHPTAVDDDLVAACRASGNVLLGYWRGNRDQHLPPIVRLRERFGVFANLRPVHSLPGIRCRHHDVDLLIVRETTEDVYAHLEHESVPGVYESLKVTTRAACERIARFGYETARAHGRNKVTIVHKANIMKKSDGLFLATAREVAADYPDIETEDFIVDALCMRLTLSPSWFDVLLCGNLFGDIVADLCAGLVGGRANTPSVNIGPEVSVFTAGHGDPPNAIANPTSLLFASVLLLRHLSEDAAADALMTATLATLSAGVVPQAAGGTTPCDAFLAGVGDRLTG